MWPTIEWRDGERRFEQQFGEGGGAARPKKLSGVDGRRNDGVRKSALSASRITIGGDASLSSRFDGKRPIRLHGLSRRCSNCC
jgi:hypothetical protein